MKRLTEFECRKIFEKYGLSLPKAGICKTRHDAADLAEKIGFPVVMKIASKQILHKSDAKCVAVGIASREEACKAYDKLVDNAKKYDDKAVIDGVVVEETLSGREVIVGTAQDPQFGPVIMFGLGGIFVEVLKDVTFRIIPIERKDASEMISEIKAKKVLEGIRGEKPVSKKAIEDVLLRVSKMVSENPKIHELDINPLFVDEKRAVCGDARIILSG